MLKSYPSSLIHPINIFKYQMRNEGESPIYNDSRDEERSSTNEQDEISLSSSPDFFHENRSNSIEMTEDQPLNLTCKRKSCLESNMDSSDTRDDVSIPDFSLKSNGLPSQNFYQICAMEQAALQYQANVLASNDFLRVFAQQKLQENLSIGRAFYPPVQVGSNFGSWLPGSGYPMYHYPLYPAPYSSLKHLSNSVVEEAASKTSLTTSYSSYLSTSSLESLSSSSSVITSQSSTSSSSTDITDLISNENMPSTNTEDTTSFTSKSKFDSTSSIGSFKNMASDADRKHKKPKCADINPDQQQKNSYPCSTCGATYPHKFELNRHIKVSHVRPHRCGQCGKGFGHRNYLKVHIETVHLGQKSHRCRLCGKYLSTGGNLNVHIRTIHYGEKKYNCPVCKRSFGQQCNMKTHMKRHYSKSDEV